MTLNKYHSRYTLRKFFTNLLKDIEHELKRGHDEQILYALNKLQLLVTQYKAIYT